MIFPATELRLRCPNVKTAQVRFAQVPILPAQFAQNDSPRVRFAWGAIRPGLD